MISHLASLADQRLIISFAPKTPYYSLLKRIGELFPGPSKVGRAGQGREGWSVRLAAGARGGAVHAVDVVLALTCDAVCMLLCRPHAPTCMPRMMLRLPCSAVGSRWSSGR